jgi:hypothetical protein
METFSRSPPAGGLKNFVSMTWEISELAHLVDSMREMFENLFSV